MVGINKTTEKGERHSKVEKSESVWGEVRRYTVRKGNCPAGHEEQVQKRKTVPAVSEPLKKK